MSPNHLLTVILMSAAVGLAGARGLPAQELKPLPFRRINSEELWISQPGRMVIDSAAAWVELWRFYGREFGTPGEQPFPKLSPQIPAVDFDRERLIAISYGPRSGCGNSAAYVRGILHGPEGIVVEVSRFDRSAMMWVCLMQTLPVDVVAIRKDARPITFRSIDSMSTVPESASWLWKPAISDALESSPSLRRSVAWRVFASDTGIGREDFLALLDALRRTRSMDLAGRLASNAALYREPEFLAAYALADSAAKDWEFHRDMVRSVRAYLVEHHGLAIAGDSMSPTGWLWILMRDLRDRTDRSELAAALSRNRSVLRSEGLVRQFTWWSYRYPEAYERACREYARQWNPWVVISRDSAGKPTAYGGVTGCRGEWMPSPLPQ